ESHGATGQHSGGQAKGLPGAGQGGEYRPGTLAGQTELDGLLRWLRPPCAPIPNPKSTLEFAHRLHDGCLHARRGIGSREEALVFRHQLRIITAEKFHEDLLGSRLKEKVVGGGDTGTALAGG